jgi:hypothetical protein
MCNCINCIYIHTHAYIYIYDIIHSPSAGVSGEMFLPIHHTASQCQSNQPLERPNENRSIGVHLPTCLRTGPPSRFKLCFYIYDSVIVNLYQSSLPSSYVLPYPCDSKTTIIDTMIQCGGRGVFLLLFCLSSFMISLVCIVT